ncbi:3-keto-disaccharide hydrolase [Paraglaciecola sp.]|uniref:3-keto-disaccharide hydrolase n=1 Tax=Paraglaciecola sp. TaxID=1920173 RepID=UPI003EFA202B
MSKTFVRLITAVSLSASLCGIAQSANQQKQDVFGYTNTPIIPGTQWHVHDPRRPQPEVVTPKSAVVQQAPADAIVLFDGSNMDAFERSKDSKPVQWLIEDGVVTIQKDPKTGKNQSIRTKEKLGDMQLHIEWRSPVKTDKKRQQKGNSGLYIMGRYEVQILDSYQNPVYPDGQAAALYGQTPPLANASLPPGVWQSYDIVFEAPKFDDKGKLTKKAHATVFHNGVLVQHRTPLNGPTGHKSVKEYQAHGPSPLVIQDHSSPVSFRNIWVRKLGNLN